jgi:hypothetical protein
MERSQNIPELLPSLQNADGGWGYYAGKSSWLEPTCWAALALGPGEASGRALNFVRALEARAGGWMAKPGLDGPAWSGSLALLLYSAHGVRDAGFRRGVEWLAGVEGDRAVGRLWWFLAVHVYGHEDLYGWPWREDSYSWVEPTVWGLLALRKARRVYKTARMEERIAAAEKMLLARRCADGGWNHGNPVTLGKNMTSYPETTSLALIGLQGGRGFDLRPPLAYLRGQLARPQSRAVRAWLTLAARMHGLEAPPVDSPLPPPRQREVVPAAIELLAQRDGHWTFLMEERS